MNEAVVVFDEELGKMSPQQKIELATEIYRQAKEKKRRRRLMSSVVPTAKRYPVGPSQPRTRSRRKRRAG